MELNRTRIWRTVWWFNGNRICLRWSETPFWFGRNLNFNRFAQHRYPQPHEPKKKMAKDSHLKGRFLVDRSDATETNAGFSFVRFFCRACFFLFLFFFGVWIRTSTFCCPTKEYLTWSFSPLSQPTFILAKRKVNKRYKGHYSLNFLDVKRAVVTAWWSDFGDRVSFLGTRTWGNFPWRNGRRDWGRLSCWNRTTKGFQVCQEGARFEVKSRGMLIEYFPIQTMAFGHICSNRRSRFRSSIESRVGVDNSASRVRIRNIEKRVVTWLKLKNFGGGMSFGF